MTSGANTYYLTPQKLAYLATVTSDLQAQLNGKQATGTYLTALPSTADFTTLTLATKAVATQEWVTGKNYLSKMKLKTFARHVLIVIQNGSKEGFFFWWDECFEAFF
jgi:hypothetical protein